MAEGDCLRWPERTDARVGSFGRYRAVGMKGSFVWACGANQVWRVVDGLPPA